MIDGPIALRLLLFALPFAASSILQQVFNSADVAVAGRFAGTEAMAAVGSNAPVINLIINIFVGMSLGANVVIATLIGRNRTENIRTAVHTVFSLALLSGIFLAAAGPFIAKPILEAIGTPEEVFVLAVLYLRIYFLGMPAVMVYNFGAAILRSKGDSQRPLYCLAVSGILNVALNLLLVTVFGMGVAGVGIATVISNVLSALMILFFLLKEEDPLRLDLRKLGMHRAQLLRIVKIGVPAGIQGMVFSFSNICIQGGINSFGSSAMAGSAAALNFEYFSYFIVSAFTQAATTFTSQNFGASQFERCKRIWRLSMIFSILITGALCLVFVLFRKSFIMIYTVEPAVISFALVRIVHVESLEFLTSTYEVSAGALRGMGHSMLPAVLTMAGSCLFRIVWLETVFRKFRSFETLMNVYPVTWIVTGAAVMAAYFIVRRKEYKRHADAAQSAGRQIR